MIITKQKSFEKIKSFLEKHRRVFICGCSECATLCKTGGEEEVKDMKKNLEQIGKIVSGWVILEPACHRLNDMRLLREHQKEVEISDALLVLACGNGVQTVGGIIEKKPVYPGCDSLFLGEIVRFGNFEERCQLCGECLLDITGGICPVTRCSKSLLNGPCGGSVNGKCEINPDVECGWQLIIERLEKRGELDRLKKIIMPKDWSTSRDGGLRKFKIFSEKENKALPLFMEKGAEIEKKTDYVSRSRLEKVLRKGKFAVTAELGPPKGADPEAVKKKGEILKECVDAVNITDNQTAIVRFGFAK